MAVYFSGYLFQPDLMRLGLPEISKYIGNEITYQNHEITTWGYSIGEFGRIKEKRIERFPIEREDIIILHWMVEYGIVYNLRKDGVIVKLYKQENEATSLLEE